jgi:uncharacterized protein (TIGR03083 family)
MTVSSRVPSELRDRVLAASRAARDAGRAVPAAPEITATEAFARAADAFVGLLTVLSPAQWSTPVLRDLDVQGLVGHLIGVERDVQRAIAGDEEVADADHIASTQDLAAAQAGVDPEQTRSSWRSAADQTLELIEATRPHTAGSVVSMHGMRLSVDALLVVRAFELWTHENDIRGAVGLPPTVPDPSVLTLMTHLAVQLLPHAVTRSGATASTDLHLVLTGAGGGTWDLPLGERGGRGGQPDATDLMIVVDAVDFCRLVANRVAPEALDVHVDGDGADHVLAAAATLALD